jgi:hypothetical protein
MGHDHVLSPGGISSGRSVATGGDAQNVGNGRWDDHRYDETRKTRYYLLEALKPRTTISSPNLHRASPAY